MTKGPGMETQTSTTWGILVTWKPVHKPEHWHLVRSSWCPAPSPTAPCHPCSCRRRWSWRALRQPAAVFSEPRGPTRKQQQAPDVCPNGGRVTTAGLHPVRLRPLWTHASGLDGIIMSFQGFAYFYCSHRDLSSYM